MNNVVFKYTLTSWHSVISMPQNAEVLSCGEQDGIIVVWARVNPDAPLKNRVIRAVNTGEGLRNSDPACEARFIGTVTMQNKLSKGMVWHIFDCGEV